MTGILCLCRTSFSDEIHIPFSVYVNDFKSDCKASGLDLYDKTSSHGFVENKGKNFIVYTFKNITDEQLSLIQSAAFKNIRK